LSFVGLSGAAKLQITKPHIPNVLLASHFREGLHLVHLH
jgi:hypothetical protein